MATFPIIRAPLREAWRGASKGGVRRTSMDAGPTKQRVESTAVGGIEPFLFKLNDADAATLATFYEENKAIRFDLDHWVWGDCEALFVHSNTQEGAIRWSRRGQWTFAELQLEIFR